ncbi:zinc finger BED domain-containing protein RICESLEEPER 1-like [Bidens hawaiensis]|uniref:zinc finger BED domain-containing protein RICESLEEPER 1-like n=1 Tax=Bidens hawaiensis TaxID=980011 RepID=UPI00404AAEC3
MTEKMKEKFDKYRGECHLLMAIAAVLDPRLKKWYVEFYYPQIYPKAEAKKNIEGVLNALTNMYEEYLKMYEESIKDATSKSGSSGGSTTSTSNENATSSGWDAFGEFLRDVEVEKPNKSELKMYLEEGVIKGREQMNFNVLDWWNTHKLKYPVLPKMASDILVVPVSTVASESTFSAGGRVIDPY